MRTLRVFLCIELCAVAHCTPYCIEHVPSCTVCRTVSNMCRRALYAVLYAASYAVLPCPVAPQIAKFACGGARARRMKTGLFPAEKPCARPPTRTAPTGGAARVVCGVAGKFDFVCCGASTRDGAGMRGRVSTLGLGVARSAYRERKPVCVAYG